MRYRMLGCVNTASLIAVFAASFSTAVSNAAPDSKSGAYTLVENWPHLPPNRDIGPVSWVDVERNGTVHVFRRCLVPCQGGHPKDGDPFGNVWTFKPDGTFVREWGQQLA